MRVFALLVSTLIGALIPSVATASLDGAGSFIYIPAVAQTGSYTSQITVRNPYPFTLPISVFFTGGTGTTGAGLHSCLALAVPASSTVQFSLSQQCPSLPAGSQFGLVTLVETYSYPAPFQAYSRTQTPGGNGFSVPAYPAGAIEAPTYGHYVIGLKRQAAAPVYQTNCFVAATDDPTPYEIRLLDSSGNQIGNPVSGSLTAYQMMRYLDIFAAAGLPPGDYANVTAEFSAGASPTAALLSFCTVQESTFFGADFRMAMPVQTLDGTRQRPLDATGYVFSLDSYLSMNRHPITFRHPDYIRCALSSATASALELRLTSPVGTVIAGGTNYIDTGKIFTGNRSSYNGESGLWKLDVAAKPSYFGPFPVPYSFVCWSGNGGSATNAFLILTADF